jgi:hypothetical protein
MIILCINYQFIGDEMKHFIQLKKILVIAGLIGLLAACGEHSHENDADGMNEPHSHSQN